MATFRVERTKTVVLMSSALVTAESREDAERRAEAYPDRQQWDSGTWEVSQKYKAKERI
jgi:hypothetical protein